MPPTLSYVLACMSLLNFAARCCFFVSLQELPVCDALSSMPLSPHRTFSNFYAQVPSQILSRPYQYQHPSNNLRLQYPSRKHSVPLFSSAPTIAIDKESRPKPDVTPFNHDIARTIFAPLFFSLYHYNQNNDDQESSPSSATIRHHYERPSPFEDPSCAQNAERMLRRMMENRYRSDGRTVCPDGKTFGLVAGAFGRLRCGRSSGSRRPSRRKADQKIMVTWEEELNSSGEVGQSKTQLTPTDKLQQLLQLQLELCHREGWDTEILPSVGMYNRALKRLAWQSGSFGTPKHDNEVSAGEQAWLWLQFMKSHLPQIHINDDEESRILCQPNEMSYAHVIDALSAHHEPVLSDSGKMISNSLMNPAPAYQSINTFANQLDIEMIESGRTKPTDLSPEWFLYEAEALLLVLEDEYSKVDIATDVENDSDKLKRALAHSYRCLLEGWGRYAVAGVSVDSNESNTKNVVDNNEDNLPMQSRERAIKRAYELLCQLEALTMGDKDSETSPPPSMSQENVVPSSCYSSIILALSISNLPSAANRAEDVLQRMMSHYGIDHPSDFNQEALSSSLFNVNDVAIAGSGVIAAHTKKNDAPRAEKVLNQMIDLYDDGTLQLFVPEVRAFGTCIASWGKYDPANNNDIHSSSTRQQQQKWRGKKELPSRQQRLHNAECAEAILSEIERISDIEAYNKGNENNFVLHATPYNIAILARVHTIDNKYKKDYDDREENEQIILHAQSILDHMEYEMGVTPDPYTYSILLHAWCQQSRPGNENAADYAEELLRRRIEDVDISKIYGDDRKAAKSFSRETGTQSEMWPNVKHYSSVLKAHAKTKSAGGAKKALALLSEMEMRFYDANAVVVGDSDINANTEKDVAKPDLVCYSIVIDAFANSRLPEASSVAHRLLKAVETKYDAGDVSMKPNTRIYTAVILSLVHSPLLSGDEESDSSVNTSGKPTNNAQQAWSILERMKQNDAPPNSFTYNYIINCAAQADCELDKKTSFEIALRAFQELRKASKAEPDFDGCIVGDPCHPDSFTYAFMLKACNNLLPPGSLRTEVMSQTFQECSRSGYLNDAVLDRLWRGVSARKFYELMEEELPSYMPAHQNKSPVRADNLPVSWSRCCSGGVRRNDNRSWKKGVKMAT